MIKWDDLEEGEYYVSAQTNNIGELVVFIDKIGNEGDDDNEVYSEFITLREDKKGNIITHYNIPDIIYKTDYPKIVRLANRTEQDWVDKCFEQEEVINNLTIIEKSVSYTHLTLPTTSRV